MRAVVAKRLRRETRVADKHGVLWENRKAYKRAKHAHKDRSRAGAPSTVRRPNYICKRRQRRV